MTEHEQFEELLSYVAELKKPILLKKKNIFGKRL